MKQLLIILSLVLGCLQPGYTQKPVLKFNKDGKFKIVQFTDVHYIHESQVSRFSRTHQRSAGCGKTGLSAIHR